MKLITVKQLMKKSKTALIRKITKSLRSMPKKKLAMLCYQISKSKLPRLKKTGRPRLSHTEAYLRATKDKPEIRSTADFSRFEKRRRKKFSKKQLAAQRLFAKRAKAGTLRKRRR